MNCKRLVGILFLSFIVGCEYIESSPNSQMVSSAEETKKFEVSEVSDQERLWSLITSEGNSDLLNEVASLIEGGVDPNQKNSDGQTPLGYAVEKADNNLVQVLIQSGAGNTSHALDELLEVAAAKQHYEIIDTLLKSGAHFEVGNEAKLIQAVEETDRELIRILLHNGYNPNQLVTSEGKDTTLLNHAIKGGDESLITMLLNAGANPNFAVEDGDNALSIAVAERSADLLTMLLAKGGDPNSVIQDQSLLHKAIERNQAELVEVLLSYGAFAKSDEEREEVMKLAGENKEIEELLVNYGW
ncbi:ankyrin repeat domain-containing protein [Alkalihalobacillus sp. CinArs1]|uniref:ankyrin repeat domain-containing protein n=1 Tax=Alkalihalobacillus sp. CinArs1 TaxID=2995314 RepID=UPI0022DDB5D4|nr:ankyrin repeat domain-containing protein [Alkalihalobacillus sp. CinArs1]